MQPDDRQVSTASGTLRQTITAIESSFFSVDCPWVEQPARPSRSAHSVETFRAQLAQEIGIAALISHSHYYYDWDDCWPLVTCIPYGSFAQHRFRFRSQHLSTESGDNLRRPCLGQKPRVKPAVVWLLILYFTEKKHFFILNDNKDKKHIILFQKFIKILYFRSEI